MSPIPEHPLASMLQRSMAVRLYAQQWLHECETSEFGKRDHPSRSVHGQHGESTSKTLTQRHYDIDSWNSNTVRVASLTIDFTSSEARVPPNLAALHTTLVAPREERRMCTRLMRLQTDAPPLAEEDLGIVVAANNNSMQPISKASRKPFRSRNTKLCDY